MRKIAGDYGSLATCEICGQYNDWGGVPKAKVCPSCLSKLAKQDKGTQVFDALAKGPDPADVPVIPKKRGGRKKKQPEPEPEKPVNPFGGRRIVWEGEDEHVSPEQ